jgi:DNA segregation ATPase FtsK/SpoIIIE, S-DNA-T family
VKDKQKQQLKTFILLAIALFSLISLISYNPDDVRFLTSQINPEAGNWAGRIGAYSAWFLYAAFGFCAYLFPLLFLLWAFVEVPEGPWQRSILKMSGALVLFLSGATILSLITINNPTARINSGGIFGLLFSDFLYNYFGAIGSYLIALTLLILSLHLAAEFLVWPLYSGLLSKTKQAAGALKNIRHLKKTGPEKRQTKPQINISKAQTSNLLRSKIQRIVRPKAIQPELKKEEKEAEKSPEPLFTAPTKDYQLPPIDLLELPPSTPKEQERVEGDLKTTANILEETLRDFNIEAKVVQIDKGPVITRYELQPAAGVKIQRIVSLSDDLALTMKATSVRVVAPIPGKDRVGIEVPNSKITTVYLREVLESENYKQAREDSKLTLAIGKDIAGEPMICDLGTMPHLLIAGTTGSGKTVCVNSIITSFLFNTRPDEVKFIMVDPKMVELAPFNGVPHLLCPVITNHRKVSAALNWTVSEMESRYEIFAREGARNIESYNKKVSGDKKLPYLVIIIDELADLMAVAFQSIENAITRLSQLSRAVGIHIILATQRPSVDVITGVIKANFPTRISFKVSSKVDSRTVLDANGADKLIGRGDMLFLPPNSSKLIRAQSPLVTDEEIERVVNFIKKQKEPAYNEQILQEQKEAAKGPHRVDKEDEMYPDALKVIMQSGQASVSILQRRLALGYTRAARLIDAMEQKGVIGSYRGSKPREILINREEYLKKLKEQNQ